MSVTDHMAGRCGPNKTRLDCDSELTKLEESDCTSALLG
jgi:hypothetical protein